MLRNSLMRLVGNRNRRNVCCKRMFNSSSNKNYDEVRIPVPWGHLAGRWWGPKTQKPILTLHGWQDNCGTFDRLLPLLPKDLSFLAIDLPGHGLSSRYPKGRYYYEILYVMLIRILQKYFAWDKVSLMGHSMGGYTSFIFAMTYPESVEFIATFDFLKPVHNVNIIDGRAKAIDRFLKSNAHLDSASEPPSYTVDELKEMWHVGSQKSVDLDKCHYILERNTKQSSGDRNKFYITRDPRLVSEPLFNYPLSELCEGAKRVKVPVYTSKGKWQFHVFEQENTYFDVLNIVKEASKDCRYYLVEGSHHHHLNNPEDTIKDSLADFLRQYFVRDLDVEYLLKKVTFV